MAKFTDLVKATLKGYFNAGDQPTEAQFASLMDAIQEGIEEHDHAGGGDGDGTQDLVGPVGIGTLAPLEKLHIEKGNLRFEQVLPPTTAPTTAINAAAGNLNGDYYYRVSFVSAVGETETSCRNTDGWPVESAVVSPVNQKVDLTNIPISGDATVTARRIYRTTAGGYTLLMKLVTTINDNTTTTYIDNIADGALGVSEPRTNTTGGRVFNSGKVIVIADYGSTALGWGSLAVNTGWENTAIGIVALGANTIGYYNTAIGHWALSANTTGRGNTAVGLHALHESTTSNDNTAIGLNALYLLTTGHSLTAVGWNALRSNTTGLYNVAVGYEASRSNVGGHYNTAIGYGVLRNNTAGNGNVGVGLDAIYFNVAGSGNTAVGKEAGLGVLANSFSNNSLFGYHVGHSLTTGSNNILIGYQAGDALTTGTKNIVIGYNIDLPAVGSTNMLNIGNLIYATNVDGAGVALSTGYVGVGIATPGYKLDVKENRAANFAAEVWNDGNNVNRHVLYLRGGGTGAAVGTTHFLYCGDGAGAATGELKTVNGVFQLADISDEGRKDNIVDTKVNGLNIVNQLRVRDFTWKANPKAPVMTSFIAQEAQEVFPAMVSEFLDGSLGTSRAMLIPILVKAIQEQQAEIEELQRRI